MVREVILVVVDVGKEIISDYAIEWTIQNVIKPDDFLILLIVLPRPNLYRRLKSLPCGFLPCGDQKHRNENSSNEFDQCKRDILKETIYAYVHTMQKLCLANNIMQVNYKVKVIVDAEVGSIATKAKEIKATWVILDRFQKKEAGQCIKKLNSNVVLIDNTIPRIIKAVTSITGENFSISQNQIKETERAIIPYILDESYVTSPSTSDVRSSTFGTYSISLPATDKQYHCKTNHGTVNDSHDFIYLNSENFDEDLNISSLHKGEA